MAEYAAAHPDEYRAFRAGRYDVVPGGETTEQVVARVSDCVREAMAALEPGECGVLVGHGAALKVSLLAILGWPDELAADAGGAAQLLLGRAARLGRRRRASALGVQPTGRGRSRFRFA